MRALPDRARRPLRPHPNRDPAFEPDGYAAFLAARGYRPDPARDHLPEGFLTAVKDLDAFYGGDNG